MAKAVSRRVVAVKAKSIYAAKRKKGSRVVSRHVGGRRAEYTVNAPKQLW